MDVDALMNQSKNMNAHYTSQHLTNAAIFPEFAEQPNCDMVNQYELWRAGIFVVKFL